MNGYTLCKLKFADAKAIYVETRLIASLHILAMPYALGNHHGRHRNRSHDRLVIEEGNLIRFIF